MRPDPELIRRLPCEVTPGRELLPLLAERPLMMMSPPPLNKETTVPVPPATPRFTPPVYSPEPR